MADIDSRELGLDRTVLEATFNKPKPGSSPVHTAAVKKVHSEMMHTVHPDVASNLTNETQNVPKLPDMIQVIEHNIDGDKSTGTLVRNPEQRRRYNQATEAAELAFNLVDKGYAQLTNGQKRQLQERLLPAMMRFMPALNDAFGPMNRRERQKAMEDILQDPSFQVQVKDILGQIIEGYKTPAELDKGDYEEKKKHYEEKHLEQTKTNREYVAAVRHQAEFTGGGSKGRDLAALGPKSVLDAQLGLVSSQLKSLETEAKNLETEIKADTILDNRTYPSGNADLDAKILAARARLTTSQPRKALLDATLIPDKQREVATAKSRVDRQTELETERAKAESEEREVLARKEHLDHEVADLYREMLAAQAELGINKLDKAAAEKNLVTDLQSVFSRAAEQVVKGRMEAADTARKDLGKSIPQDALTKGLAAKYLDAEGNIKKDLVKADYKKLLEFKANDLAVAAMVAGGMSEAEAKAAIANDKELAKKAQVESASELMTRYIQAGNKMKPEEARRLLASDIGDELLGAAMDKNKQLDDKLKEYASMMPEEEKHDEHKKTKWVDVLKKVKIPTPTKKQLLIASLLMSGGFFYGPQLLTAAIPVVNHALSRWVMFYKANPGLKMAAETAKATGHQVSQGVSHAIDKATTLGS